MIVTNKQNEIEELTVAQLATRAEIQEDKELVRVISSLQEMIPDIMNFPIVRQTFTVISKTPKD